MTLKEEMGGSVHRPVKVAEALKARNIPQGEASTAIEEISRYGGIGEAT